MIRLFNFSEIELVTNKEEKLTKYYHMARKSKILHWAQTKFNWRPRVETDDEGRDLKGGRKAWFQTVLLGCFEGIYRYPDDYHQEKLRGKKINKFAWRVGRQCLAKDSIIHDRDGSLIKIQNHPNAWKTFDSKEIFEVKVEGGYAVRCTANHPIMTNNGWINASQLKRGDKVQVMDSWDKFGTGVLDYNYQQRINKYRTDIFSGQFEFNNELAELLGWITSDGSCLTGQSAKFTNINLNYLYRVEFLVKKYFEDITVTWYQKGKGHDLLFTTKGYKGRRNSFKDFIRKMDVDSGFPRAISYATKEQCAHFFRAMFAGDGWITYKKKGTHPELGLSCGNSRIFAEYCRELLNKFGIHSQIKQEWMKKSTKWFFRVVALGKQNAIRFLDNIGEIPENPIKEIKYLIKHMPDKITVLQDGEFANFRNVISVKSTGFDEVWDVEFPGKGWFFSGGVQVSNSGKCISEGTIIHTRDGKLIPIEEHPNAFVTEENGTLWQISMNNGYSLRTTKEHQISVRRNGIEQWMSMNDIKVGDEVECLFEWDKWGDGKVPYSYTRLISAGTKYPGYQIGKVPKDVVGEYWRKEETILGVYEINNNLAELLGWLTADGNYDLNQSSQGLNFRNANMNYIDRVKYLVNQEFPEIKIDTLTYPAEGNNKENHFLMFYAPDGGGKSRGKNSLLEFLRSMNFHPSNFPRAVAENFTKEQVCAFIRGAWAGDGNFYFALKKNNNTSMTFEATLACSLNRTYTEYFSALFNKLGIPNKIDVLIGEKATAPFHTVRFKNKYCINKFRDLIGQILDKPIPEKLGKYKIDKRFNFITHEAPNSDGEKFIWSKVWRKEKLHNAKCYDVEVPFKKWFVCSSSRVHNSECLSLGVLYLGLCKPVKYNEPIRRKIHELVGKNGPNDTGWRMIDNWKVRGASIILASRDAPAARLVFERVMSFIDRNPVYSAALEDGMIGLKLHPFPQLTINIPGWTKPAVITFRGPGANGQALRGFTFDYKLYDEADYMPDSFFETELATSINAGANSLTILSSTPTGKRAYFHSACFDEDAPVVMSDGTLKAIKDVSKGDMVVNRYGESEEVTDTFVRSYKGKIVSITTSLNDTIVTGTANHRIMAVKKRTRYCRSCLRMVWKNKSNCIIHGKHKGLPELKIDYIKLGDLEVGDFVAVPRNLIPNRKKIGFHEVFDNFIMVAVNGTEATRVEDKLVYNLEVGKDHSYCVNGYGVANCTNPDYHFEEFHFPSFENPNYTEEEDMKMRTQLTAAGYEHEILANWGTTEYGVFDWTYFEKVFSHQYKIGRNIKKEKTRIYEPGEYECIRLTATDISKLGLANLASYLRMKMPPRKQNCTYYFGSDLGYKADPSEFVVFEVYNGVWKLILRINMQHIAYEIQADMVAFLDKFYLFEALGMDEGGNGLALSQSLMTANVFDKTGFNKYASHNFAQRLAPINFGKTMDLGKQFSKERKVPAKQWMTDLLIKNAEEGLLLLPNLDYDSEIENQFRNHTYTMGSNGNIVYSKSEHYPEHVVDACRSAFYAKQHAILPKSRKWIAGSTFKSQGSGGWR